MMLSKSVIKKILLFSMILGVLTLESWAESRQINEKVKYTYEFIAEFGEYKPHLRAKYIYKYTYDARGNVVGVTTYNFQGELDFKVVTKYDEKGNAIERTWYDSRGTLVKKFFYKYDERENQVESTTYDSQGQLECKFLKKYDEKGNMVESVLHDSVLGERKDIYKYDEKGNMVEEVSYDYQRVTGKTTYKYNEKGNMVEEVWRSSEWDLEHKTTYEYDEKGNMVEKIGHHPLYYHSQGVLKRSDLGRTTYEYDEEGNEIVVMEYIWKSAFGKTQEIPVKKTLYEYEYY